ncbi:hypothetical protein F4779DRAFT_561653 [Xylariaceae sp. FL0662B]|nr:hypothetical protein F4779DRAFT_561653 [Xylariaceae sp. FL0662B]
MFIPFYFILLSYLLAPSVAEPVQYCRFGHQNGEVDFCVGITIHHNYSALDYDMYLSMTVTRSSALGWTAIGTGPEMAGSLMFIVYGDPMSGKDPIISIRTASGHHQPRQFSRNDMGGADLRVLQAQWLPAQTELKSPAISAATSGLISVAKMAVVCYACSRWPGSPIMAEATSQPWIWAWNDDQEMTVYSFDAPLNMHKHHTGNGGWGNFYVDMARSIIDAPRMPSFPPLRPGIEQLGTSSVPIGAAGLMNSLQQHPLAYVHGISMTAAFLILCPLGVLIIKLQSTKSFKRHWIIQVFATFLIVIAGGGTGLAMIGNGFFWWTHQSLGMIVIFGAVIQGIIGWAHHVQFLKNRRRTWISHTHLWLGRMIILGGWGNVLVGILHRGHDRSLIAIAIVVIASELVTFIGWTWTSSFRPNKRSSNNNHRPAEPQRQEAETYLALGETDYETDGEEKEVVDIRS